MLQRINTTCCSLIDCFDVNVDFAFFPRLFFSSFFPTGPISPNAYSLNTAERDEPLYLSSTTLSQHDTTSDKEHVLVAQKNFTTTTTSSSNRDYQTSTVKVYESDLDETDNGTQIISIKSTDHSPYDFSITNMSTTTDGSLINYRLGQPYKPEHYTQTKPTDFYDHSTNTIEDNDEGYDSSSRFNSKPTPERYLTPTKYRGVARLPLANMLLYNGNGLPKQDDDDDDMVNYGDKIIIPTKYRLRQDRINRLLANENRNRFRQPLQAPIEQDDDYEQQPFENEEIPSEQHRPRSYEKQQSRKRTAPIDEPVRQKQQSNYPPRRQSLERNVPSRESSPEQAEPNDEKLNSSQKPIQSSERDSSRKRTQSVEEPVRQKRPSQQRNKSSSRESSPEKLQTHRHETYTIEKLVKPREDSPTQYRPSRPHEQELSQKSTASVEEPQRQTRQQQSDYRSEQRNASSRESSPELIQTNRHELNKTQKSTKPRDESPPQQQQPSRRQTDSGDESLLPTSRKGQAQTQDSQIQNITSPKRSSNYEPRVQRNGFPRESPPSQRHPDQSNYYEIEVTPQRNGSIRHPSASPPRQFNQQPTDSGDESTEEHSQYFGQAPSQNRAAPIRNPSPLPPTKLHSNYEPRVLSNKPTESPNNVVTPREEPESNYYELEVSPERNLSSQKVPSPQRPSARRRTNSGDDSVEGNAQYYGQAPIQNRKASIENSPSKQAAAEHRAQSRPRNESPNSPPSLTQQQQRSNYYELDRTSNRMPSVQEQPVRQHQPPNEDQQRSRGPYDSTAHHDHRSDARTTVDHQSTTRHYRQIGASTQNIERDNLRLPYNRYRIIDGDFEVRENPSHQSRSGQIQFLFKAILQGRDSQENDDDLPRDRAPDQTDRHYTPSTHNQIRSNERLNRDNHQSSPDRDPRNRDPTDAGVNLRKDRPAKSNYSSRLSGESRDSRDQNKDTRSDDIDRRPLPSSNTDRKSYAPLNPSPPRMDSDYHITNQPPVDNPAITSRPKDDDDLNGIDAHSHTSSRPSPQTLPPRNKYYFGKNVEQPVSDDDSDEADCEMFGQAPQPRPLNNTNTRRNLNYSSVADSRLPSSSDHNTTGNPRFLYQNTIETATDGTITQQQQERSPSLMQSADGRMGRSVPHWQPSTNRTTPQRTGGQPSDDYINLTNYIDLNENFSNATANSVGFTQQHSTEANNYEENRRMSTKQPQSSNRFSPPNNDDRDDSPDDDDDDIHDVHDRPRGNRGDSSYIGEVDDDDDRLRQDDDSPHSSLPQPSGVNQLLRQNPVRDLPTTVQPSQYRPSAPVRSQPPIDTRAAANKKSGGGGGLFGFFRSSKTKNTSQLPS